MRHAAFALLLAVAPCGASTVYTVAEPWVRPAAQGAATELYLELRASVPAELVGVESPLALRAELVDARGKAVPAIALPPGRLVRLERGGLRARLVRLTRGVTRGGHVPLTLTVRAGDGSTQDIPVEAEVRLHSPSHDHGVPHAP